MKTPKMTTFERGSATAWTIAIIVILVAGLLILGRFTTRTTNGPTSGSTTILESINDNDWSKDNLNASVTLTEYSDFECPACAAYYGPLKAIHEKYGADIRFVYRHFPLAQHPNARLAARASEAAGNQGKFFEMHDMLFDNQKNWERRTTAKELFESYAEALGLDMDQYRADYDDAETLKRVEADYQSGIEYGVQATPTFFINNERYNFNSLQEFEDALSTAIATSKNENNIPNNTATTTP